MQSPHDAADASRNAMKTALGRELHELDVGDGIGMVDAVSRALEQLEAVEAVEMAYTAMEDGGESDDFGERDHIGCGTNDDADAGPQACPDLMTTEQVRNAASQTLRSGAARDGEQIEMSSTPDILDAESNHNVNLGPRQRMRLGLRRRKKRPPPEDRESETEGVALYGTKGTVPFSKSIANYFKTVGSTQEKRVTALTAWGVSVIGLIVCLVFVTKDFISSKSEAMVAVRFSMEDVVQLPELFICSTQNVFPVAWKGKEDEGEKLGHYGAPTQWVELLRMPGKDSEYVKYPDTHSHANIDQVVIDRYGDTCSNRSVHLADAKRFNHAYSDVPHCFSCFKIKADPPVSISRALANDHIGDVEKSSFSIQVAQSRALESCRGSRVSLQLMTKRELSQMVVAHADELVRLGIVDFSGQDPSKLIEYPDRETLDFEYVLWHQPTVDGVRLTGGTSPTGVPETYVDRVEADRADMLCNTVLFSGVWYPKPDSQEIKYKYNTDSLRWERTGAGPYFPLEMSDFYTPVAMTGKHVTPNQILRHHVAPEGTLSTTTLENFHLHDAKLSTLTQRVFVKNTVKGGQLVEVSALRNAGTNTVYFQQNKINNATSFVTMSEAAETQTVDGRSVNAYFLFQFAVRDFLTRNVSDQETVQVTSFLADFFGLIELFLDLSVYTLIISPIVVATKRRALLSRARAQLGPAPISPV